VVLTMDMVPVLEQASDLRLRSSLQSGLGLADP
jgi:hypothetical protein